MLDENCSKIMQPNQVPELLRNIYCNYNNRLYGNKKFIKNRYVIEALRLVEKLYHIFFFNPMGSQLFLLIFYIRCCHLITKGPQALQRHL